MEYKTVSDINLINQEKWVEFVNKHPKGNIFQTPFIYNVYSNTENYSPFIFILINNNGEYIGVLVGVTISYFGVNSIFTSRNVVAGGPLVINDDTKLISILLSKLDKNKSSKTLFTEIRNFHYPLYENKAYQSESYKFYDHLNFLIDISKPKDDIFFNIDKSRRKSIKKAIKNGLTFSEIDLTKSNKIEEGYWIIQDVYKRAKLPLPKINIFNSAAKNSNKHYKLKMFAVFMDNKMIGIRFALLFKDYIYGWYAGSYSEYYKYFPNEFLAWKTLEWGHEKGYKVFDYGGAGKPNIPYGVRDFKSKFGGKLTNYGRYNNVYHPLVFQLSKIIFKIFRLIN